MKFAGLHEYESIPKHIGNPNVLLALLKGGANPNLKNPTFRTAFFLALDSYLFLSMNIKQSNASFYMNLLLSVRYLLLYGAKLNEEQRKDYESQMKTYR
ncbi:MAG TPA: hypothetical protein VHA52_04355 [Candidatus Babeliaceae bacterium]|nr:hypothetical protein [Candidatus Babeliaceae bacterium]